MTSCVLIFSDVNSARYLRLHVRRVVDQRVWTVVHQLLGGSGCLFQELVGRALQPQFIVVLAVRALKQADPRLEGQCHPTGDKRAALHLRPVSGAIRRGERQVLQHVCHHRLAAVASLVELLRLPGVERMFIPGHIAEGAHHVVVEVGPPEASHPFIMAVGSLVDFALHLRQVVEEVVHLTEVIPGPSALLTGVPGVSLQEGRRGAGGTVVGILVASPGNVLFRGEESLQEAVGVELQVVLRGHESLGPDGILRLAVQEVLARGASQCQQSHEQECIVSFHLRCR